MPTWTPQDQAVFAPALKAWKEGQIGAEQRQTRVAQARADAFGRIRLYPVMDAQGNLRMATPAQVNANPDQYAPAGPAVTARNRASLFGEIDTTAGMVDDAIKEMGDEGFDATSRAQIALVLRDSDPKSAVSTFMSSVAAATLTPAQIDYVTALASMQESALSLRSLGGIGAGSDLVRGAIIRMIPGAGTPSRAFAERQMKVVRAEVNALRKAVPKLPGQPELGAAAPAGAAPATLDYNQLPEK
jgi:hypothetical protein